MHVYLFVMVSVNSASLPVSYGECEQCMCTWVLLWVWVVPVYLYVTVSVSSACLPVCYDCSYSGCFVFWGGGRLMDLPICVHMYIKCSCSFKKKEKGFLHWMCEIMSLMWCVRVWVYSMPLFYWCDVLDWVYCKIWFNWWVTGKYTECTDFMMWWMYI